MVIEMISDYDRTHIFEILSGHGDWFGARLMRLIPHLDSENYEILKKAYPDYFAAYEDWYHKTGINEGKSDD